LWARFAGTRSDDFTVLGVVLLRGVKVADAEIGEPDLVVEAGKEDVCDPSC
jgi:hypothetical protein